jgi:hypothetical protein
MVMITTTTRKNPFCGARFAPGVLPWIERTPGELDKWLTQALRPLGGARHQILGPHGSGKSTLLIHLERRAWQRGLTTLRIRGSQCSWLSLLVKEPRVDVLFVDEVEELGRVFFASKATLLARWLRAKSLIVSTHRDLAASDGFSTLVHRDVDVSLAQNLIRVLSPHAAPPADLDVLLERHDGNLREVFFELYDRSENESARSMASSSEASSFVTGGSRSRSATL